MRLALKEAARAGERGDVPVGAVLARGGQVLAARGNERELRQDPTAHAELLVLREAAALLGGWRLLETSLYVTVEPCPMCAGALLLARVGELVYGAPDPRGGAAGSVVDLLSGEGFNHRLSVRGAVLADESAALMRSFFGDRRGTGEDDFAPRA
jgi:tRNA(adenine34) deaminase